MRMSTSNATHGRTSRKPPFSLEQSYATGMLVAERPESFPFCDSSQPWAQVFQRRTLKYTLEFVKSETAIEIQRVHASPGTMVRSR